MTYLMLSFFDQFNKILSSLKLLNLKMKSSNVTIQLQMQPFLADLLLSIISWNFA